MSSVSSTRLLIDVIAKTAGAEEGFSNLQKRVKELSGGVLTLGKNSQFYEKGVTGAVSATRAWELIGAKATAMLNKQTAAVNATQKASKAAAAAKGAAAAATKSEATAASAALPAKQADTIATKNQAAAARDLSHAKGAASFAVLSFTQGVQDAGQFGMGFAQGIRAVNNNLQQFVTATILANDQAGGFKSTMGLMIKQLKGPAGWLLAFSAASALMEAMAARTSEAKEELKGFREELEASLSLDFDIKKIELRADGVYSALEQQRALVDALARDVEGSALDGEGRARTLGTISPEAEERMLAAGMTTRDIQRIRRAGLEGLKQELADARAVLKLLEGQRTELESKLRVQEALSRNAEVERQRQEDALELDDGDLSVGDKSKKGAKEEDEMSALEARRISFAEIKQNAKEMIIRGEKLNHIREEEAELLKMIVEFEEAAEEMLARRAERAEELARARAEERGKIWEKQGAADIELLPDGALDLGEALEVESWFDRMADSAVRAGSMIGSSMGQAGSALMQLAKTSEKTDMRLFKAGKRIAIATAIVNTATGITRAYKDLPVWAAIPASASIAAAGAAQIAAIRAAQPGGGSGSRLSNGPNVFAGITSTGMLPGSVGSSISGSDVSSFAGAGQRQSVDIRLVADGRDLVGVTSNESSAAKRRNGIPQVGGGIIN